VTLLKTLCLQPYSEITAQDPLDLVVTVFCTMVRASRIEGFAEDFASTRIEPWKASFWTEVINSIEIMRAEKSSKKRTGPLKDWAEMSLFRLTRMKPFTHK
jgi:hypothetical protein